VTGAFSGPLPGRDSPRIPGSAREWRFTGIGLARAAFVSLLFRCFFQCNAPSSVVKNDRASARRAIVRAGLGCGPLGWVTRRFATLVFTRYRDNFSTNLVHGKKWSERDPTGPGLPDLTMFAASTRFPLLHLCSREPRVGTVSVTHRPMRDAARPFGLGLCRP
jgi:hypothetical protein